MAGSWLIAASASVGCLVTPKDYPVGLGQEQGGSAGSDGGAGDRGGSSNGSGSGGGSNEGGSSNTGKGGAANAGSGNGGSGNTANDGAGAGGEPPLVEECTDAADCTDNDVCTSDSCVEGACLNEPVALPPKASWVATASVFFSGTTACAVPVQEPAMAVDGNLSSRWSTGKPQAGDEWIQVDFGAAVTFNRVSLDTYDPSNGCGGPTDYPRHYVVRVTSAPNEFGAPIVLEGDGADDLVVIEFPDAVTGRYLLISQTGVVTPNWWSVAELDVACE